MELMSPLWVSDLALLPNLPRGGVGVFRPAWSARSLRPLEQRRHPEQSCSVGIQPECRQIQMRARCVQRAALRLDWMPV